MIISDGKSKKSYGGQSVQRNLARFRGDTHEKEAEAQKEVGSKITEGHSTHDHAGQEGEHDAIKAIHEAHGPAQKLTVEHDGENHKVTTEHEDGHVHESHGHPSVEHAHAHIGHAIGKPDEAQNEGEDLGEPGSALSAMGEGSDEGEEV